MCRRNLFHSDLRVCSELQVQSKTASRVWFYAYKKYKNGNSARRTAIKRHIRPAICFGGSDNFSSGISGKLPKIETSNVIFSRNFAWQFRRWSPMTYFKTVFILVALSIWNGHAFSIFPLSKSWKESNFPSLSCFYQRTFSYFSCIELHDFTPI